MLSPSGGTREKHTCIHSTDVNETSCIDSKSPMERLLSQIHWKTNEIGASPFPQKTEPTVYCSSVTRSRYALIAMISQRPLAFWCYTRDMSNYNGT